MMRFSGPRSLNDGVLWALAQPVRSLRRLVCLIAVGCLFGCIARTNAPPLVVGETPRTCWVAQDPARYFEAVGDAGEPAPCPKNSTGGWKIVLGSEVRNGFLLPCGERLEKRLEISGSVKMRCALARPPGAQTPASIVVTVVESAGEELPVRTVELEGEPGAWTAVDFDLSAFEGKTVDLRIEASVSGSQQPDWPVFVANPEFLARGQHQDLPDILLIVVDTLRADRLSLLGYHLPTTPHLDRWARENAVIFPEVIAAAPWTLPAHVSLFTGLDAIRHGVNHDVGGMKVVAGTAPVTQLEFMAETLRRAGYSTAAFTGGAYVGHDFGFAQGFDIYSSWPDRARDHDELSTGVDRTLEFFSSRQTEPAFVFLHTYAVHDPYRAWPGHFDGMGAEEKADARIALHSPKNSPELGFRQVNQLMFRPRRGGQRPLAPGELDLANQMYDSGVRFVDEHLGDLLKSLNQQGLDRNLIVVLTSDHGEALGEDGRFGHVDLTDEVLLVPLLLAFPDRRGSGKVIERQVRQVDIWPTVADVVGLTSVADWDGASLVPLVDGGSWTGSGEAWAYSAAANRGVGLRLEGHTKMIFDNTAWSIPGPRQQLFDLKSDRSEVLNLAEDDSRTEILLTRVAEYLGHSASGLRLRLVNRTEDSIIGTLGGPMIRPVGTKILTPGGPVLKWKEMGSAEFVITPNSDVTFSFEKVFGRKLRVRGSINEVVFDHSFDVRSLKKPAALSFDGARWVPRMVEASEVSMRVWWHGGESALGEEPARHTTLVEEQLRALGYVE